jgi:signal transduction histidine kinase
MKRIPVFLAAFSLLLPVNAWGFVPQDFPAMYTHEMARMFLFVSLASVLAIMIKNRLYRQKGWRFTFCSVIIFILWDMLVFMGRFSAIWIIGETEGMHYFQRMVVAEGWDYFFYLARLDQILLDIAMVLFYLGLREHRSEADAPVSAAYIPFLPILITDIAGTILFIILAALGLLESSRLYRRDRDNALWSYMIWLSISYLVYSISRAFGQIAQHFLIATERNDIWQVIQPYSGSLNTVALLGVGVVSLFFIRTYQIYLKMSDDRKQIEDINSALASLNRELETLVAERTMALMGLTVADKIRNPAFLIACACRRIIEKEHVTPKVREYLSQMIDECQKLESIVGDFESIFKTRKGMFKFGDISAVVMEIVSVMEKEAADKGIKFIVNLPETPLNINMQKNLLKTALFHVIRNAIEATPPDGTVDLSAYEEDERIILLIRDTGTGIEKEYLDKIFDPFFSTKQYGFGMGLPLVKQIVMEHLGRIDVESEKGKGTTFRITFPVRWEERIVSC